MGIVGTGGLGAVGGSGLRGRRGRGESGRKKEKGIKKTQFGVNPIGGVKKMQEKTSSGKEPDTFPPERARRKTTTIKINLPKVTRDRERSRARHQSKKENPRRHRFKSLALNLLNSFLNFSNIP